MTASMIQWVGVQTVLSINGGSFLVYLMADPECLVTMQRMRIEKTADDRRFDCRLYDGLFLF